MLTEVLNAFANITFSEYFNKVWTSDGAVQRAIDNFFNDNDVVRELSKQIKFWS